MGSASDSAPLLRASALTLARGGRDLFQNLSLAVYPGQLWHIEGPNGAGKTSLIRILSGLSRYGFDGSVVCHAPLLYIGHHTAVKALLTPRENLQWHVSGQGQCEAAQIDSALARVGLAGYEDVPSHALSAGQQRRVNLARLYLSEVPLWLLDEPFAAIDQLGITALEALLDAHVHAGGAVVIISHQPLQVSSEVQRLNVLSQVIK